MDKQVGTHHRKRLRAETRFRRLAQGALMLALLALMVLLGSILTRGMSGFYQSQIKLSVTLDAATLGLAEGETLQDASVSAYTKPIQQALKARFPEVEDRAQQRDLLALASPGAASVLRMQAQEAGALPDGPVEVWLPLASPVDLYLKSNGKPVQGKVLNTQQEAWVAALKERAEIRTVFNRGFFTRADSRQPEQAGFLGAMTGSVLLLLVCFAVAFPLGVMTAVYLEEFSRPSRVVDIIEVNINNLAAVPSIVFGLLGLAIYLNYMHLPRSSALAGGLTMALLILPVIIITTRTALRSVPGSIRDAARALGATPLQVVWHHTLPLSMPGIMTGTILGLARAIGETAPLLMIGMVAFIASVPGGPNEPATVMPVQIYLWASSAEAGFIEKTAAGIIVLLALLMCMNALAIFIRRKFEVRW